MKKALLFSLVFIVSIKLNLQAQNPWCATNSVEITSQSGAPKNDSFERLYRQNLLEYNRNSAQKKQSKYVIPVVFHIIHQGGIENISDNAIQGLVKQVNDDLALRNSDTSTIRNLFKGDAADCEIELRLAQKDEDGNCTNGITRTFSGLTEGVRDYGGNNVKTLIKWDNKMYLNIWVVKSIVSSGEGITLGYAYYPGQGGSNDGIVMLYNQMNSNTLTHELGHYLNLKHTFDNGCFDGDDVDDTPPAAQANFGCPKTRNSCTNDVPDLVDQVENYMDYSDCSAMFTHGQKVRMHSAIDFYRSKLVSDDNLKNTGVNDDLVLTNPIADFSLSQQLICRSNSVTCTFTGCDHSGKTEFLWKITGTQNFESTESNPTFTFDSAGVYNVELKVSNSLGSNSKFSKAAIWVVNEQKIITESYSRSFNGLNSLPTDYQFINQPENFGWQLSENGVDQSTCLFVSNFT